MKRVLSMLLAAALMVPLAACGSGEEAQENAPVTTLGWFLLEREVGEELDDLTDQETYLVHVYDITPDESENVEPGPFESSYSITLNGANTYEPLYAPASYDLGYTDPTAANYFMVSCGYAAPWEIETILAGGEPIRAMAVYRVNTNDFTDDTNGVFTVENCGALDCEIPFSADDITPIARFDDVFQVEENPEDYMIAAAYFQRVRSVCSNAASGYLFQDLLSNGLTSYQNSLTMVGTWTKYGIFSVTGLEGLSEDFMGDTMDEETLAAIEGLPAFDIEAVKRIYPDLPVDEFETALDSWLTNGQTAVDALNAGRDAGEAGDLADAAVADMKTLGPQILNYYAAHISNE